MTTTTRPWQPRVLGDLSPDQVIPPDQIPDGCPPEIKKANTRANAALTQIDKDTEAHAQAQAQLEAADTVKQQDTAREELHQISQRRLASDANARASIAALWKAVHDHHDDYLAAFDHSMQADRDHIAALMADLTEARIRLHQQLSVATPARTFRTQGGSPILSWAVKATARERVLRQLDKARTQQAAALHRDDRIENDPAHLTVALERALAREANSDDS